MTRNPFVLLSALGLLASPSLLAHSRWIVPSHTILSEKEPVTVTFDIAVSNDIFHADRPYGGKPALDPKAKAEKKPGPGGPGGGRPRPEVKLQALQPNGQIANDILITQAGRKSVSHFTLDQSGTYRFSVVQAPTKMTVFKGADGKPGRQFGEHFEAKALPAGAKDIVHVNGSGRVETFVSHGGQAGDAIKPMASGLDLSITPHPNDLFVNETSEIQVFVNGKPAGKDIKVNITPNGTRYRNDRGIINLVTDDKGKVSLKWAQAGLYLVELEHTVAGSGKTPVEDRFSLFVTLEVNPS